MKELLGFGILGVLQIVLNLAVLYVIAFYIAIPAISIVAKMFGFPGAI